MYKKIVFVGVLLAGMSVGAMELSREVDEPQVIMYVGEEQNEVLLPKRYAELMGILELVDDPAFSDKFRFSEVSLIGWKFIADHLERLYKITHNAANADALRQEIFIALSELEAKDLKEVIFAADYLQIPRLLEIAFKGTDKDKCPLLHWAAQKGRLEVVELLIGRDGIDVNLVDGTHGGTPLHCAAFGGHVAVVKFLLDTDVIEINAPARNGATPLHCAALGGNAEVVKLLLGRDEIEVNAADKNGVTPLSWEAEQDHVEVVKLLLGRDGIKVNIPDNVSGFTPLHWAALKGHTEVVNLLLARPDVEVNAVARNRYTPLYCAALSGHRDTCLCLVRHGLIRKENCARDAQAVLIECTAMLNAIYSMLAENNPVRALFSENNRREILEILKQEHADSEMSKQ